MPSAAVKTASPSVAVSGNGAVKAPIPGIILEVKVAVDDTVTAGQTVVIMEAMKMENNISSPVDGKVKEVRVAEGSTVADGDMLMLVG
jgi:biotin carboxyl carrier protein